MLFFGVLVNAIYIKTKNAGFVFDMTEWLSDYIKFPNFNYLNPPFDGSFRPVYHFILYNTFHYFDTNPKAWYILYIAFFLITLSLILVFFDKLFHLFELSHARILGFITTLAIALSPFNTEIVVWYATIHYHVVFICLFALLNIMLILRDDVKIIFIASTVLFCLAILSIELSYSIMPISWLLFFALKVNHLTTIKTKSFFKWIISSQLIIFVGYNLINYFYFQKFLGHYHIGLVKFSIFHIGNHYLKLFIKHILLLNYFGQSIYEPVFDFVDKWGIFFNLLIVFILYFSFRYFKSKQFQFSKRDSLLLFLVGSSILIYIPISFLYFHSFKEVELDRLGVGFSFFIIPFSLILGSQIKHQFVKHSLLVLFLLFSFLLLKDYTTRWENSQIVRSNFVNNFPNYSHKNVIVLGAPILFKYVYLFAINDTNEIKRNFKIYRKIETTSKFDIVAFYGMSEIDNMIAATKVDSMTLRCDLKKWGNWYWKNLCSGLVPKETSQYILTPTDNNFSYTLKFKHLDSNDKILLFNQLNFKEVDFKNARIGETFL